MQEYLYNTACRSSNANIFVCTQEPPAPEVAAPASGDTEPKSTESGPLDVVEKSDQEETSPKKKGRDKGNKVCLYAFRSNL